MLVNLGTGIVSPRVGWNKRSTCRRVDYGISGDVMEGNCLLNDKESQAFTRNSRGRPLASFCSTVLERPRDAFSSVERLS